MTRCGFERFGLWFGIGRLTGLPVDCRRLPDVQESLLHIEACLGVSCNGENFFHFLAAGAIKKSVVAAVVVAAAVVMAVAVAVAVAKRRTLGAGADDGCLRCKVVKPGPNILDGLPTRIAQQHALHRCDAPDARYRYPSLHCRLFHRCAARGGRREQ